MKLYLISQDVNNDYDTYDSAIVCAETKEEARKIHPSGIYDYTETDNECMAEHSRFSSWAKKKYVSVEYIGEAKKKIKKGVVLASFNAG